MGLGGGDGGKAGPTLEQRESVATVLRRAREHYGEDLRSVAQALRIRYVYLLSIEEGRFKDLPGTTYAVGFIRTYAEYLGLDGDDLVYRFKEEVDTIDARQELVFPTPPPEGKVPGGALILISVLLVALAYGTWFYLSSQGKSIADLVPAVPERLAALIEGEDEAAQSEAPASASEEEAAKPAETMAAVDEPPAAPDGEATVSSAEPVAMDGDARESDEAVSAAAAPTPEPASPPVQTDESAGALSQTAPAEVVRDSGLVPSEPTAPVAADADTGEELTVAELTNRPAAESAEGVTRLPEPSEPDPALAPTSSSTSGTPVTLARVLNTRSQSAETGAATPATGAAEPAGDTAGDNAIPAAPAATQMAAASAGREPQVYGADNADARIVLRARQDSWVQVRDADDGLLITRVLRSGDEYRVPNRPGLTLLTGNAGGIEIVVDGARLSPIGPIGAVRRDVVLDPDRLKQGTALPQ